MSSFPQPLSLTHQHILAAINTEFQAGPGCGSLRLLDVGCGEGHLMAFLQSGLAALNPGVDIEVHGFDVHDTLAGDYPDFPDSTVRRLSSALPAVPWRDRVRQVSQYEPWPYSDGSFRFVVTNQVLEHVVNLPHFLGQLSRVLAEGGCSLHLFPLRNALCDGHVRMPLVHKLRGFEQRSALVRLWSRLGLGTSHQAAGEPDRISSYLHLATSYRPFQEFVDESKHAYLRLSYRYTQEFYLQKFNSIFGMRQLHAYRRSRLPLIDWLAFCFLRHISSVTLVLEKPGRPGSRTATGQMPACSRDR